MPPAKKLDLIPAELLDRLKLVLAKRGFGDIIAVTDDLNGWLQEADLEIRVGKTAVGEFSKILKDQRDAFSMVETLLSDMDLQAESEMHRTLLHMITTSAMQMMRSVREGDKHLPAGDLMNLGRMLKDLMGSTAVREKLLADDRLRIQREEREKAASVAGKAVRQAGMSKELEQKIKASILGIEQ